MYRIFQSGLATFQALNRHMWLVAATLSSTALESSGPTSQGPQDPHWGSAVETQPPLMLSWAAHSLTCPLLVFWQAPHDSSSVLIKNGRFHKEKEQK